jgi:hypothetical protein
MKKKKEIETTQQGRIYSIRHSNATINNITTTANRKES